LIDAEALSRYANRILSLRSDRKAINDDMGEVFAEAKEAGFVPAMIRGAVREMEMDAEARATFFATQAAYRRALGLLADTPLGAAAVERATAPAPAPKPTPFAEQPIGRRRGRPRKDASAETAGAVSVDDALSRARRHLGTAEPAGAA
jgi:uncharacterized protein (UPF0335 family)